MKKTVISSFVLISLVASLLNYLTYPILARLLPAGQFVNITISLSLLTQVSTFLSSIVALTVGITKQDRLQRTVSLETLQRIILSVFIVVVTVFIITSPYTFKKIDVPSYFVIPIALLLIFSIPTSVISGYLNGKGRLVKLSLVGVFTAIFQFIFCIFIGYVTRNGGLALMAMGIGQLISIIFVLLVFRKENFPKIIIVPSLKLFKSPSDQVKKLIKYAILSSIAIMLVNILQIADLLIIKQRGLEVVTYTDFYVISRVVFFAGTIFIWPYLSLININSVRKNVSPTLKLIGLFIAICGTAMTLLYFYGGDITGLVTGRSYSQATISVLGLLGIAYKLSFLIITAMTLYFIVLRRRTAYLIPFGLTLLLITFIVFLPSNSSINSVLVGLNIIGLLGVALCGKAFMMHANE